MGTHKRGRVYHLDSALRGLLNASVNEERARRLYEDAKRDRHEDEDEKFNAWCSASVLLTHARNHAIVVLRQCDEPLKNGRVPLLESAYGNMG